MPGCGAAPKQDLATTSYSPDPAGFASLAVHRLVTSYGVALTLHLTFPAGVPAGTIPRHPVRSRFRSPAPELRIYTWAS